MRCAVTQFQQRIGARIPAPHRACVCGFMRTQALIARLELSSRSRSVSSDGSGFVPLQTRSTERTIRRIGESRRQGLPAWPGTVVGCVFFPAAAK